MATSRTATRGVGGVRRRGAARRAAPRGTDANGLATLSPDTEERLNVLMRSDDGVRWVRAARAIFVYIDALPTRALRIAAFAYVLRMRDVAQYSGDSTPASEYPEFPFTDDEIRERGGRVMTEAVRLIGLYVRVVDGASYAERMARAWGLVADVRDPMERFMLFARLLENERGFRARAAVAGSIPYNRPLPDAQWRTMLWEHRDVIIRARAVADAVFSDERVHTKGAVGALLLAALEGVDDPEVRANLFGFIIHDLRDRLEESITEGNANKQGLLIQLGAVAAAAEEGLPCPNCGKVHRSGGSEDHRDQGSPGYDSDGMPTVKA